MPHQSLANKIWDVADILRGDFKQLPGVADATFYNTSQFSLASLGSTSTRQNLEEYISSFSPNARLIFDEFGFESWIAKLESANLLYLVAKEFKEFDLHPDRVSNHHMGLVFEHLIRKFAESANDTAGEFFTPRDVVRLATTLVFATDHEALGEKGVVRTVYDCAAGTGGFLSSAIEQVSEWNPNARLIPYAQELNPETHAICVADKLIQGYDTRNIKQGNTISEDKLPHERFDYCLANPPFGVDWKKVKTAVTNEHRVSGLNGRFGAGLPRVNDGSMLFLMHLLSKRKPKSQGGTRVGIVLSGSPLFNGGAGSGESEIRRWILENDWLEAIIALPTDMFYNTGIGTYIWIISTNKEDHRQGLVQLIDATGINTSMRSLGSKRKFMSDKQIEDIARIHDAFEESEISKIFNTSDFGYRRITVERPLQLKFAVTPERLEAYETNKKAEQAERFADVDGEHMSLDAFLATAGVKKLSKPAEKAVIAAFSEHCPDAEIITDAKGRPLPDPNLRDNENVPMSESVDEYFEREVLPHVPDAWIDTSKKDKKDGQVGIVGYEINFNRYFYTYVPPRPLSEIDAELKLVEEDIANLLSEVAG